MLRVLHVGVEGSMKLIVEVSLESFFTRGLKKASCGGEKGLGSGVAMYKPREGGKEVV